MSQHAAQAPDLGSVMVVLGLIETMQLIPEHMWASQILCRSHQ